MKAAIFHSAGKVTIANKQPPKCQNGEILLKVSYASLCASDIRVFKGEKKAAAGVIPGHEFSGLIVDMGGQVKDFRIGDKVSLCPILSCGSCAFCIAGMRNRCEKRQTIGYDVDGGFAEYVLIPKKIIELNHLFKLSDNANLKIAALVEPLACVMNSMKSINLQEEDSLIIIGGGPMGLMHGILAMHFGVSDITIIEPEKNRRDLAELIGINKVIEPKNDLVDFLNKNHSLEGYDKVILSVGITELVNVALALSKKKGVVNLFAGFPIGKDALVDVNAIHYKELSVLGTQNATLKNYLQILEIIDDLNDIDSLITNVYKLDQVPVAYEDRLNLKGVKSIIDFTE